MRTHFLAILISLAFLTGCDGKVNLSVLAGPSDPYQGCDAECRSERGGDNDAL